jgi:hypothetical protein
MKLFLAFFLGGGMTLAAAVYAQTNGGGALPPYGSWQMGGPEAGNCPVISSLVVSNHAVAVTALPGPAAAITGPGNLSALAGAVMLPPCTAEFFMFTNGNWMPIETVSIDASSNLVAWDCRGHTNTLGNALTILDTNAWPTAFYRARQKTYTVPGPTNATLIQSGPGSWLMLNGTNNFNPGAPF